MHPESDLHLTGRQQAVVDAARNWAAGEEAVRALLLKGSIAAGHADELSDIDLLIVTVPGRREELWRRRRAIAQALGRPLGLFDEAPWQAPYTAIALYDGPTKVDLFFQDGEPAPDPWLQEGFIALVDDDDVATALARRLSELGPPPFGAEELRELDAHAFDWIWWLHVKLERGERWLAWVEMAWFVDSILLHAHNVLAGEPWRGASRLAERVDPKRLEEIDAALPRSRETSELRRALRALADLYIDVRRALATQHGVVLSDELMGQVRSRIEP